MSVEQLPKIALAIVLGGILGFGWYKVAGCHTGACPLSSNPYVSVIFGALVGALIATAK
jgi:hypothetical protein